jgi:hypothetical protein
MTAFAGQVMIVQLLMRSPVFLSAHSSYSPAITIEPSSIMATA